MAKPFLLQKSNLPQLNFRVEVKKCFNALAKLPLDVFPATFQDVHRHPSVVTVFQLYWRIAHFGNLIGGQQPHSINQSQVGHA